MHQAIKTLAEWLYEKGTWPDSVTKFEECLYQAQINNEGLSSDLIDYALAKPSAGSSDIIWDLFQDVRYELDQMWWHRVLDEEAH